MIRTRESADRLIPSSLHALQVSAVALLRKPPRSLRLAVAGWRRLVLQFETEGQCDAVHAALCDRAHTAAADVPQSIRVCVATWNLGNAELKHSHWQAMTAFPRTARGALPLQQSSAFRPLQSM